MIEEAREQIGEVDRALLAALNRRLEIVTALHDYKLREGIPLRDPDRETSLIAGLQAENDGPMSDDAVARFFDFVLAFTRDEIHGP